MANPVEYPGRISVALALAAAVLAVPFASSARQIQGEAFFPGGLPRYAGITPSAGFSATPSDASPPRTVMFYAVVERSKDAPPRWWWVARRATRQGEGGTIIWADSRRCPLLVGALTRMTWIAPAHFDIAGLQPSAPIRKYKADGTQYLLWSNSGAQPDGSPIEVVMSGTGGGVENWAVETEGALEACWTPTEPKLVDTP